MILSQKRKGFCQFCFGFSKSTLNFELFGKKVTPLVDVFPI